MASIYQLMRDGKPARRKDGSYIWAVDYKDAKGKRQTKTTFRTKKDATKWLSETVHDLGKGTHIPSSEARLISDLCDFWISNCEDRLERSTVKQYREHAELHIKPRLGHLKVNELTRSTVIQFVDAMRKERSEAMARKALGSLKAVLSHAMDHGLAVQNVAYGVKVKGAKRGGSEIQIPDKAELNALLSTAREHFPNHLAFLHVAIFTGLRLSELRGLRWDALDLENGKLHVRQRADGWNTIGDPKTAKSNRTISIGPETVRLLREWKLRQPAKSASQGLVFASARGTPYNVGNLYNRFLWPLQEKAGVCEWEGDGEDRKSVPRYGFHAFRHFYASALIAAGKSVVEVQNALGHAQATVTLDTYSHLFKLRDGDDDGASILESAILG